MSIEKRKLGSESVESYTPFREMRRMIDRIFDEFPYEESFFSGRAKELVPAMDIFETDKGYEIEAEVPGIKREDIEVNIDRGILTIKGEKKDEHSEEKKGSKILERTYGTFERSFTLPEDADANNVSATYDNGTLKLTIPKHPESKSKKVKIEVK